MIINYALVTLRKRWRACLQCSLGWGCPRGRPRPMINLSLINLLINISINIIININMPQRTITTYDGDDNDDYDDD